MSIKTLIVDDTISYRKILSDVVSGITGIEVVGTAANGVIALRKLAVADMDLVLLDVNMPEMDGIETLSHIRREYPDTAVIMVSGSTQESARTTLKALEMGALDFIRKPDGSNLQQNIENLRTELARVIRTLEVKIILKGKSGTRPVKPPDKKASASPAEPRIFSRRPKSFSILAIGISTGGPNALNVVIPGLPADFPIPVVVVQHMPPVFTEVLARDLDRKSALNVVEASEGLPVERGKVIIAKGGCHMIVRMKGGKPVIGLTDAPPENSCRPAVDVLFRSVANSYEGKGVLAVIMTGMGSDGLAGVRALKRKQCYCITQSESTCVVYGMPRAIDESGLSDESVDLKNVSGRIVGITGR